MKLKRRCEDTTFRELEVEWKVNMIKTYGMFEVLKK